MNLLAPIVKLWNRTRLAAHIILNRYEGATFNPKRSAIPAGYTSARFDASAYSRSELARKMRYFERNNVLIQALAGKFENFVVGSNPQLTPNSSEPEWNQRAKEWWDQWCRVCDISSRQHFGTILSLIARRWFIEGDIFVVLTSGAEQKGKRPRIQLIEGHLLRTPPEFERDEMVHDGVRMDSVGRPILYYFAVEVRPGKFEWGNPVDAEHVIPVFEPERPGEVRGITHFHACINQLHDLDDLCVLEMLAAKDAAEKSTFINTASGELPNVEQMRREIQNRGTQTSAGTAVTEDRTAYVQEAVGGRVAALKMGETVTQFLSNRPTVTQQWYWGYLREEVCASVEIPKCIVYPDSMQGTVYRGALDMASAAFKSRHAVIAEVQRRIWEYVIGWAVNLRETGLADKPADWKNVSILPPRAPNVDVGRNSAAMLAELEKGATNFDLIYGPQGLSWRVELKKLDDQLGYIKDECKNLHNLMMAKANPQQHQLENTHA